MNSLKLFVSLNFPRFFLKSLKVSLKFLKRLRTFLEVPGNSLKLPRSFPKIFCVLWDSPMLLNFLKLSQIFLKFLKIIRSSRDIPLRNFCKAHWNSPEVKLLRSPPRRALRISQILSSIPKFTLLLWSSLKIFEVSWNAPKFSEIMKNTLKLSKFPSVLQSSLELSKYLSSLKFPAGISSSPKIPKFFEVLWKSPQFRKVRQIFCSFFKFFKVF